MFTLNCFIDLSNGRPGMLIPIISSPDTNLPYVQQMDEFLLVKEVIPFLEYEHYPTCSADVRRVVVLGDRGLIAFRSPNGEIFCGNSEEALHYIRENQTIIAKNILLRAQLNRIESQDLQPSYDVWRSVAAAKFDSEKQRTLWLDSELRLFQKQKQIWTEIDPGEVDPEKSDRPGLERPLSEYSPEHLIRWLSIKSNYFAKAWSTVWHHVNVILPFDDRISLLGIDWMYALNEEDADLQQSKSILFALFHRSKSDKDFDWKELADFLLDRFTSEPYLIYNFTRPRSLFYDLMIFLSVFGAPDHVLQLIDFCIQNVPKEERVIAGLEDSLEILLKGEFIGEPQFRTVRELEAKDVETAWNLVQRLDGLPNR